MNKLYSFTGPGNVHQAVSYINESLPELVDHVLSIEFNGGYHSTVLVRAPQELIGRLKKEKRIW